MNTIEHWYNPYEQIIFPKNHNQTKIEDLRIKLRIKPIKEREKIRGEKTYNIPVRDTQLG